jgi:competence protein ComEC
LALLGAACLAAGLCVGALRLEAIDAPVRGLAQGQRVAGVAEVLSAPRAGPFGESVEVRMASGPARGARLLARLRHGERRQPLRTGVRLRLAGSFQPLDVGSSFDRYLAARGVGGELDGARARGGLASRGGWRGVVDRIGQRARSGLTDGLDPTRAALALGMVLGDDAAVPISVAADFRDAGLAHLLAASGSNVALLCGLAGALLAAGRLPHRARGPLLLGLIALYVLLGGAGPSIQRAGVMGAAALAAAAVARPASRPYALGLAACVTLALNPRAWHDPGWQLSFTAVAGILVLAPRISRRLGALPRPLADGVALTVAAALATAPLLAHHFGTVAIASLPANVAAVPLVAPIMWLGMLRGGFGQLGPNPVTEMASGLLAPLLAQLIAALELLARTFADMPGGQLALDLAGPLEIAAAYVALATAVWQVRRIARRHDTRASTAVAYVRRLPPGRRLALALACVTIGGLVLARGLSPVGPPAELTVSFLDVGQGDATLIQHPDGSAVLFDGGPPEGAVARLLRRAGVRRLSMLVMTHPSRDHHGGLGEVVEQIPIDVLLDGGDGTRDPSFRATVAAAADRGAHVVRAVAPLGLRIGGMRVEVLSPGPRGPGPAPEDPNPRAVVAIVRSGGFDLLLSADAESEALLPLALPDVDAMKVPHHGSADPGLPEVLERLRPEIASVPVGPNTYGHPAPSTLAALADAGASTWRNDRNGTVRLVVGDGQIRVTTERGGPVPGGP